MLVKNLLVQPALWLGIRAVPKVELYDSELVLTKEVKNNALLLLNRPGALNATTLEMIEDIAEILHEWKDTKSVIVVRGNGGKAFCAGGDVKAIAESEISYGTRFFRVEYTMSHMINNMKIPYVSLIDGITMGGGVGIAVHGKYRVATEKTIFAMPEVKIGLFPDIGASFFLPRLQGKLGYYLGLTGSSVRGADVFHAGIATHYCESSKIPDLEHTLLNLNNSNDVEDVINDFCPKTQTEFSMNKNLDQINKCFDAHSVEEIVDKLRSEDSEFAKKTLKVLGTFSPTSLKVTFRQLSLGEKMTLGQCLQMEYRLLYHFLEDSDFQEGVRALLIAKDKNPQWNPPRLEEIPPQRVHTFFRPLPKNDSLPM